MTNRRKLGENGHVTHSLRVGTRVNGIKMYEKDRQPTGTMDFPSVVFTLFFKMIDLISIAVSERSSPIYHHQAGDYKLSPIASILG